MPGFIDLTGYAFGRLTVKIQGPYRGGRVTWVCECSCGKEHIATAQLLRSGKTTSCGCYQIENTVRVHTRHGMSYSAEYRVWHHMIDRCYSENDKGYHDYGGRGISVCDRWRNSFEDFYADVGPRPTPDYSIDRFPNNDGNYEPSNVRWATRDQQNANRRSIHLIEFKGKIQMLSDWSRELRLSRGVLDSRINKLGWDPIKALTTPVRKLTKTKP